MKKIWLIVTILILSISFAGCSRSQTPQPSDIKDVVITLERTVCFGYCPDYTLTIKGDGTVTYEGRQFVTIEGTRTTTVSEEKIRQLLAEFEKVDYFSLKDNYVERTITDAETVITSITVDGKTKTIEHYHGDFGAPNSLTELEDKIDVIINSAQWIK